MDLTQKDILSAYNYLKTSALISAKKNNIDKSLNQIEACAKIAYNSNFFYTDQELEKLVADNAKAIGSYEGVIPIKGRYAFIDTNGSDNHGLTQQYIRALISAQVEFVYIYEDTDLSRAKIIFEEIRAYPKATIYTFDKEYSFVQKTQLILQLLVDYKPEKYLMHIMPWDVVAIMICILLKDVVRYNINATDHAFWLGATCIDYCIEFRNYGYTVSLEKRGLREEQLIMLPYYPTINNIPFQGFPILPSDSIKILSGGSFYKIYGENGKYFEIVKTILIENPKAVLLFAGGGDNTEMSEFIKENDFNKRVYLLGSRADIYEVFKAADIFLGTYPISGGLMSQYAAICGKPILAYTNSKFATNFLEGVICHEFKCNITYTDIEKFHSYANKLCCDNNFRIDQGLELKNCIISSSVFNEELKYVLLNNKSKRILHREIIDYDSFARLYLEVENYFQPFSQKLIASKLRLRTVYKFPKIFINTIGIIVNRFFIN